jgi:predicted dehydrogenase
VENKEIRWGIIGCGAVTEVKSGPAYQKTPGFKLDAVMRRDHKLALDYANRHKIPRVFETAMALISDPNIDAIYIATPPDSHRDYGIAVAEAGKICCIEKPLAPSYQDCLDIVSAFERTQTPLYVAYYRRSLPRFNKVKALLEAGEIGVVRHINWHLNKPTFQVDLEQDYNWRTDKEVALGGYFDDLASHGLDLFSYLFGEYEDAKGIGVNQQGLYSAYDSITACWSFKSGITGAGNWNFGALSREDRVVVYGSKGQIEFSVFDEEPITIRTANIKEEVFVENPENIQLYHVKNMQLALTDSANHPSSGASATHTAWVMDKILIGI